MKKETKQQSKNKLLAEIYFCIASGLNLEETRARSVELCKLYFPNADIMLITAVKTLAERMQNLYYEKQSFDLILSSYKTRIKQNDNR